MLWYAISLITLIAILAIKKNPLNTDLFDFITISSVFILCYLPVYLNHKISRIRLMYDQKLNIYIFSGFFIVVDYFMNVNNGKETVLQSAFWVVLLIEAIITLSLPILMNINKSSINGV